MVRRIRNSEKCALPVKSSGAARDSQYEGRDRILGRLRRADELRFALDAGQTRFC